MLTLNSTGESRSLWRWQQWWPLVVVVAVLVIALALLARGATAQEQEQNATATAATQFLPALFVGTVPGSHSFRAWVAVCNLGATAHTISISFLGQNGAPIALALSESQTGSAAPQSTWNWQVGAGETKKFYIVSNPAPLLLLWAKVINPAPKTVTVFGRYQLFGLNGDPRGPAFFQAVAEIGKDWTIPALELGLPSAAFTQRVVPIFADNPGTGIVSCSAALKDSGNVQIGTALNFTIAPNGQYFSIFSAPSVQVQERARVEVSCSDAVVVLGSQFLNDQFYLVNPQPGIFVPNQPPIVNLENPPATVTSSAITVSGWAVDLDGTLTGVEITLDNGPPRTVVLNVNRPDVLSAYPTAQLNSGFSTDFIGLANGQHMAKVRVVDSAGASVEQTRTFTVNRPAVEPEAGEFWGPIDPLTSTPSGVADQQSRFYVRVVKQGNRYLADSWNAYSFLPQCAGGTEYHSFGIIGGMEPHMIVNGDFSFTNSCGPKVAVFETSTRIRLESTTSGACLDANPFLARIKPCQVITLRGYAVK